MKFNPLKRRWSVLAVTSFLWGATVLVSQAQPYPNYAADQFDTDTTSSLVNQGWGSAYPSIVWDTQNATTTLTNNTPGSGSALWNITWPNASGDQVMVARWFSGSATLNLNHYTNVSFDIRFDPNCGTDGANSYGAIEIGCIPQSDGWPSTSLGIYTSAITNGNGWIHVSLPINAASNPKLSAVIGYYVKIQQSRTGGNLASTSFWLDNVIFGGNNTPPPPPTLALTRNTSPPGLMIVCGGLGGTYTRGIRMAFDVANSARNYSWVGQGSTPVTYSKTIVAYPDTNHPIQDVIFLVQNGQYGDPGVDYDAANVAQLSMYGNADGTATANFQYKTNQPTGNSQFGANTLVSLTAPSPLGTWSVTFLNDTNVTINYVPLDGGTPLSASGNFPDDIAVQTYFSNPLSVYMGNQQNADANAGQSSTYSEFKISGVTSASPLDTVWSSQTSLDTTNWGAPAYANDQVLVHSNDTYWVNWTLPDSGFTLSVSTNLASPLWTDLTPSPIVSTTSGNRVLVPGGAGDTYPTGANPVFFSLIKRSATQLQVLLPGETNAPNTVTGKVGVPAPVAAFTPVVATINAVDATFHIVSSTDALNVTTGDPGAYFTTPATPSLVNGTATVEIYFGTPGSWTVGAADTTSTNLTSGTSSPITIQ